MSETSDAEIRKLMKELERELIMEKLKSFPINKEEFIKNITPEMNNIVFPCYVGVSSPPERDMQEINDCYSYDYNVQTLTEEKKMSSGQAVKVLNCIRRFFTSTHRGIHVDDARGKWKLELTNSEDKVFLFHGYVGDYWESLSRTSQLIREATGLKYLIGFCEDTQ